MIKELIINNYSIIDNIDIEFSNGLNVLTGETGAGKTVLINALGLALGMKIDKKTNIQKQKSSIIAIIQVNDEILEYLNDLDIPVENPLIIKRIINNDNKSKVYINDNPVSMRVLNKIGEVIVDFHGQHEHQMLLKKENQIKIIDLIAGNEDILSDYKNILEQYNNKIVELKQFKQKAIEYEKEKEFMEYALRELEEADIENIDEMQLQERLFELEHFEELKMSIADILLISSLDENYNIMQSVDEINRILDSIKFKNNKIKGIKEIFNNIRILLDEANRDIELFQQELFYDEEELQKLRERMNSVQKLKQKYKMNIDELIEYKEKIAQRLEFIKSPDNTINKLNIEIEALYTKLIEKARLLHSNRERISKKIFKEVNENLKLLNMKDTEIFANIEFNIDNIKNNGMDNFELMIKNRFAKNGQSLKNIASGGELSRIMLALKNSIFKDDPVTSLIFDEIDTGISGKTAELAACLLKKISENKQLIVITHLPQIASKADAHFIVNKTKKTVNVKKLNKEERIKEIARLLGSSISKDTAIKHAKALLNKK